MPFHLLKFYSFETQKPENPKGLNLNTKVNSVALNPNPIEPETWFAIEMQWNPNLKAHARPQPEPEKFWTQHITNFQHYYFDFFPSGYPMVQQLSWTFSLNTK